MQRTTDFLFDSAEPRTVVASCIQLYARCWEAIEALLLDERDRELAREMLAIEASLAITHCERRAAHRADTAALFGQASRVLAEVLAAVRVEVITPARLCCAQDHLLDAVQALVTGAAHGLDAGPDLAFEGERSHDWLREPHAWQAAAVTTVGRGVRPDRIGLAR